MKILTAPQSGSQAGTTASRNRFGQYLRTKAIPVQPRTPKQTFNRAFMTLASSGWRAISDANRDAWNTYAQQLQFSDSLGQTYSPTGAEAFAASAIASQNSTPSAVPPTVLPTYLLLVTSMTYTDPTPGPEAFEAAIATTSSDNFFSIETSGPVSPGITSAAAVRRWVSLPVSALNISKNLFAMSSATVPFLTQYKYMFPSPTPGQNIWFRFREIFFPTGESAGIVNHFTQNFRFIVP